MKWQPNQSHCVSYFNLNNAPVKCIGSSTVLFIFNLFNFYFNPLIKKKKSFFVFP